MDFFDDDYNSVVVKKGIVRYKFVISLFILCICIFHSSTFDYIKEFMNIKISFFVTVVQGLIFSSIVYSMLYFAGDSFVFSPCNIELDIEDYFYYYKNLNINDNIEVDESNTEVDY